jgi:hypothetical protein
VHLGLPIGLAISLALPLVASLVLRLQADTPRLPLRARVLFRTRALLNLS